MGDESKRAGTDETNREVDVCLVLMPFVLLEHPSLALGILKKSLEGTELRPWVIYANLLFAEKIGLPYYKLAMCGSNRYMLDEWFFVPGAFPDHSDTEDEIRLQGVARKFLRRSNGRPKGPVDEPFIVEKLRALRPMATAFVDELAKKIVAKKPKIVGCSSSFSQHIPSLALLRHIKMYAPEIITLIGGANCEEIMGVTTVKEFPWVDYAFSGEADEQFYPLCQALIDLGTKAMEKELPEGTIGRTFAQQVGPNGNGRAAIPRALVKRLDNVPEPDYSDYFETLGGTSFKKDISPGLLMETSRGCWWKMKEGCTFCGLCGRSREYRSKSPERALAELRNLTTTYGINRVAMVDNVPAPHYFSTFLPQLAKGRDAYELFYETRCHLKRDQVKMLADAGVVSIQPGIEALDNRQLALMNKGTTTLMNLQMLKYAREFSLQASWRLIVGLPGEKDDWHLETASWFPLVHHLQPPMGVDQVRMLRFSSYHSNAEAYGLDLVPNANYTKNYPLSEDVLSNLVYYFQRTDVKQHSKVFSPGVEALSKGVKDWQQAAFPPVPAFLCMQDDGDTISILDTRACAMERQFKIDGMAADILRSCDPALERSQLLERMTPSSTTMNRDDILDTVEMLKAKKLLLEIDQYLLSLPTQGWFPDPKIPGNRSPIGFSPDPKPEDFLS